LIFLGFRKQGAFADWKNDANSLQIVVELIVRSGFDHCRNAEFDNFIMQPEKQRYLKVRWACVSRGGNMMPPQYIEEYYWSNWP
jgi:hypothetical protein